MASGRSINTLRSILKLLSNIISCHARVREIVRTHAQNMLHQMRSQLCLVVNWYRLTDDNAGLPILQMITDPAHFALRKVCVRVSNGRKTEGLSSLCVSTTWNVPWQRIEVISGPDTSMPSSLSNVMPDDSTMKGNATAGDMGDFATLMNLRPVGNR
jgi:hypothetical protein